MKISLLILSLIMSSLSLFYCFSKKEKIGFVDSSRLFSECSLTLDAKKELEKIELDYKSNLKKINDSLSISMQNLKKNYENSSKKEKQLLKENFEKWNESFSKYSAHVKEQSPKDYEKFMGPVVTKINMFIKNWAISNNYKLILGTTNEGNILHGSESIDITHDVLFDLNKKYSINK